MGSICLAVGIVLSELHDAKARVRKTNPIKIRTKFVDVFFIILN